MSKVARPERISIHALREEGDRRKGPAPACSCSYFYPRPPRGGRPAEDSANRILITFLSTPSARRATNPCSQSRSSPAISIHALREEGDQVKVDIALADGNFYPRPPRGGRPAVPEPAPEEHDISIHALREEGDIGRKRKTTNAQHFYPRPPRGGRLPGISSGKLY